MSQKIGKQSFLSRRRRVWQLYLLILIPLVYLFILKYYPLLGAQIAFKDYSFKGGIWGSKWVGFKHFIRFLNTYQFLRVVRNTIVISLYSLIAEFPLPILLAISLSYLSHRGYAKIIQTITYSPYFISTVVMVSMILQFLSTQNGMLNNFIELLTGERINFLSNPENFYHIYVWSGAWQYLGFSSIIYIATLAGIDPTLHEAAMVDGATIVQRIRHIDLPGLLPTAIILFILRMGRVLDVGFEKVFLMQNPLNLSSSEVISTYVYKIGVAADFPQFSYGTAVGLTKSALSMLLLIGANFVVRKIAPERSLW